MGKVWPGDYTSSFSSWFFIFKGIFQYEAFAYFGSPPPPPKILLKEMTENPFPYLQENKKKIFFSKNDYILSLL